MHYKRALQLLSAAFAACILSSMIVASCTATSPLEFSRHSISIVVLSTLIGALLSYIDTLAGGMLTTVAYAIALSLLGPSPKIGILVVFILSPLFGAVFLRYPILSVTLAGISLATLSILTNLRTVSLFVLLLILVSALHQYSKTISSWLSVPFRQLARHRNRLLAFGTTYFGIATTFGLLYQTMYLFAPDRSFSFQTGKSQDFTTFMYLSLSTINSAAPPAEVVPISITAKLLLTLESLTGLFLLVVFIQFFLLDPRSDHEISPAKRRNL